MDAPPRAADSDPTDWTFVIERGCEQCGYVPHDQHDTIDRLRTIPSRWAAVLSRSDVAERPREGVWSPLEYACHSRDLMRVLGERVESMLTQENPQFADYDGEAEAVRGKFWAAEPLVVAMEITENAAATIAVYERVGDADWERTGVRGDGRTFTITELSRYLLHDLEHHLADVGG